MGPVNWFAVLAAAAVAAGVAYLSYGPFRRERQTPFMQVTQVLGTIALMALPAGMLGHMFARTGTETLDAKPWLYFMMSGGTAIFYIGPVLWFTYARRRLPWPMAMSDIIFSFVAFLAMGLVFWLFG